MKTREELLNDKRIAIQDMSLEDLKQLFLDSYNISLQKTELLSILYKNGRDLPDVDIKKELMEYQKTS